MRPPAGRSGRLNSWVRACRLRWLGSAGAKATEQDRDSKYGDEDAGVARCLPSVHDDGDEGEAADVGEGEEQSEDGVLVGVHPDIMVKRAKATASRARSDDVPCAAATSGDLSPPGKPLLHDHLEVGTMQFLVLGRKVGDDALLSPARKG